MTELQEGDELRLMMGGEVVGSGVVLPDGNASFQLDSGAVAVFGERLVRGYSIAGEVSGGPSPSVDPVPDPIAGDWNRNSFAFRMEPELLDYLAAAPRPSIVERNWEAVQDELAVDLRGNPRPGFVREPFPFPVRVDTEVRPADVEGIEVQALLCSTDSHAGTVPAVVFGQFRVPWWEEERSEPAGYCGSCARLLGFMGYFTPEDGAQG
ncbi:hypothetical protein SEA_ORCANUS_60 [Arthrobacter phage Orcanus]|nr:hypothetical protein SEA_ORCANUS_60 [Arthrobacter phage Orcanus]